MMDPILTDSAKEGLLTDRYGSVANTQIAGGECRDHKKARIPVRMAALIACLGSVSFGYALEYASPALPELQERTAGKLQLNQSESAWFTVMILNCKLQIEIKTFLTTAR